MGKILIFAGLLVFLMGVLMILAPHIPFLGNLPGDIHIRGKTRSFYFPIVSCIILSILLTIFLNLFMKR